MRAYPAVLLGAALAASTPATPAARAQDGTSLVCETFCHETKLRTGCARLRLVLPGTIDEATGLAKSASATPIGRLEVTVFKGGFERGLYATLTPGDGRPIKQEGPSQSRAAEPVLAPALASRPALRAFQIQLAEAGKALPFAPGSVTIEGLEPGLTYTWRLGGGATVSCMAPTCPADMFELEPRNPR